MKVRTFFGGIHPKYNKERSAAKQIQTLDAPSELIIPLSQHIGAPAIATVKKGDSVLAGQKIGESGGFVSAPIHSSISGKVVDVVPRMGSIGIPVMSVVIENDGEDNKVEAEGRGDGWETMDAGELIQIVKNAGVVGMGGATFPSHVKLSPPPDKPIDTVILNGAECEPYLTADHRLMIEKSAQIVTGLQICMKILGAKSGIIGIEENKPDAIELVTKAVKGTSIAVVPLEIKYPQGGEKQLIDACLQRKVPSGGLPMDVGVVVQNVATAFAIREAVVDGTPLTERVVTITGSAIKAPANLLIKIGTPIGAALDACGADMSAAGKLILGGPMMGFSHYTVEPPVVKGTSGILLLEENEIYTGKSMPCIRCGRCVEVCPMNIVPADIAAYAQRGMFAEADGIDTMDCMECGSCAHECPSRIPLVQHIRLAKASIGAARRKKV